MVEMVKNMLELHEKLENCQGKKEVCAIQDKIHEIDREIDRLVYKLYDLTDEEINIIENSK